MLVEIVESEDKIKEVVERLLFSNTHLVISTSNLTVIKAPYHSEWNVNTVFSLVFSVSNQTRRNRSYLDGTGLIMYDTSVYYTINIV